MSPRASRIFWPIFWIVTGLIAYGTLLYFNETAREVSLDAFSVVFSICSTPIIFESTCIIVGICVLMLVREWQDRRDGDGWVYLAVQEPDADEHLPRALTERLQSTVLAAKPEKLDEAKARGGIIEGYLELGMGAQALAEFNTDTSWPDDVDTQALKIRVLAVNLETEPAQALLAQAAERFPGSHATLAIAAIESARWLNRQLRRGDLAKLWVDEAVRLHPDAVRALRTDETLKPFLAS